MRGQATMETLTHGGKGLDTYSFFLRTLPFSYNIYLVNWENIVYKKNLSTCILKYEKNQQELVCDPEGLSQSNFRGPNRWKIIDLPGGQIYYPLLGIHLSLPFLPITPLSLSRTFEGLFWASHRITSPPYSIHLGEKNLIPSPSKVLNLRCKKVCQYCK